MEYEKLKLDPKTEEIRDQSVREKHGGIEDVKNYKDAMVVMRGIEEVKKKFSEVNTPGFNTDILIGVIGILMEKLKKSENPNNEIGQAIEEIFDLVNRLGIDKLKRRSN